MSRTLPNRNVTPLLEFIRGILRGKPLEHYPLRFTDQMAARTQPQPNLPGGPYAKTTQIYYYTRDGRREVEPPTVIVTAKELQCGSEEAAPIKCVTPGKVYIPE